MPVGKITKEAVDAVPLPPRGKREHLWDDAVKGFGLMVTDRGIRSYILQYRIGGRGSPTRRVTIGRHGSPWTPASARKRAIELLEQVRRKIDPFDAAREAIAAAKKAKENEKTQQAVLARLAFDKIAAEYVAKGTWVDGKRIRTWQSYDRIIERDLKPQFGSTPLTQISADDIGELLHEIGERGASASRRAHIVLTNIFKYAAKAHPRHFKARSSPMIDVPSPAQSAARERHLSDDELRLVWTAAGRMDWPWREVFRLLILTGARLREVAHVPWAELNLAERAWIIPGERTKNGDPHLVPITDTAFSIWQKLPKLKNDAGLVFPSAVGTALTAFSKAKQRLDEKIIETLQDEAKAAEKDPAVVAMKPWRIHDLRRTVSVGMQRRGVLREVIDVALNHRTGGRTGITGVYQVYRFQAEKADAFAKWDAFLSSVVEPRP
jgi:integrase